MDDIGLRSIIGFEESHIFRVALVVVEVATVGVKDHKVLFAGVFCLKE